MQQLNIFSSMNTSFNKPLASRLRPQSLDDFVGQRHLLDDDMILSNMIKKDNITSMIFWGPPGVGKTTLARIIAKTTKSNFITFSAVTSGIKEIKDIMLKAEENRNMGIKTIVFVDEIHRFNKAQQDAFLPFVEKGSIILIGATTENPSFEINSALLSRCKVFILKSLNKDDIISLLQTAINKNIGFPDKNIHISDKVLEEIAIYANGDARLALNTLELMVNSSKTKDMEVYISDDIMKEISQNKVLFYDKTGEEHYNLISAFHKSLRNSDCDGAIYWMMRMLEGGEDPIYIARRMVRFASEDIGLADFKALSIANEVFNACRYIGLPECEVSLCHAAIYLALAPKSNSVYMARNIAKEDVKNSMHEPVPLHLRNAPTNLAKDMGCKKDYKYAHDYENGIVNMQSIPTAFLDRDYYKPKDIGEESYFIDRIKTIKEIKNKN